MKNAYLAICYICNENCKFCPCSKKEKQDRLITPIEELKKSVDKMQLHGVTDITLSGGEPTLHPDLLELVGYIQEKNIKVTILSNGERFSSALYILEVLDKVDITSLRVITTLHSSKAEEHEKANQTIGSFERSIAGLKNLSQNGAKIIIKHCITKENYQNLVEFYKYCTANFEQNVDVQLCSIDYCGIPQSMWENEKILFRNLKPYLEELLDYDIQLKEKGSTRRLYCINMPLCSCDPFFWKYMPRHREKMYDQYKDPHKNVLVQIADNVGTHKEYCKDCKVKQICCGTYFTAYDICKSETVIPYV